jgi:hypothetical protein
VCIQLCVEVSVTGRRMDAFMKASGVMAVNRLAESGALPR